LAKGLHNFFVGELRKVAIVVAQCGKRADLLRQMALFASLANSARCAAV
jgi:hypothetical protein